MDRVEEVRLRFAENIAKLASVSDARIVEAFATIPREAFVGEPPWRIFLGLGGPGSGGGAVKTSDPKSLYQDVVVALQPNGPVNNGQPSLHAACLNALRIREGETVTHIGAGTGYYTALLAFMVGSAGRVTALEIDFQLAQQATANLARFAQISVVNASGSENSIPASDVVYVNAGATAPLRVWLDALNPNARLLFPLTPDQGYGGMLLITRVSNQEFAAAFISSAMFIPCIGARDAWEAEHLSRVFRKHRMQDVQSLRFGTNSDETCWFQGKDWWLSTAPAK